MELDHVLVAVRDLDRAGRVFAERYGLESSDGGRHPDLGTANRIVPLGDTYLELIAVVDPAVADGNPFGRRVREVGTDASTLVGWSVRTSDLDGVATRLGLRPEPGSRTRADGSELRWRLAGVGEALATPSLPFFIEREAGASLPGHAARGASGRLERITLSGDAAQLGSWLGPHDLPVTFVPGSPGLVSVRVVTAAGRAVEIGG